MIVEQAHGGDGQHFRRARACIGQEMALGRVEVHRVSGTQRVLLTFDGVDDLSRKNVGKLRAIVGDQF